MTADEIRLFQKEARDGKDAIAFAQFEIAAQLAELNATLSRVYLYPPEEEP